MISESCKSMLDIIEKNEEKEISRICSEYVLDVVSRLCSSRGLNRVDVSDYLYKLGYISDVSSSEESC